MDNFSSNVNKARSPRVMVLFVGIIVILTVGFAVAMIVLFGGDGDAEVKKGPDIVIVDDIAVPENLFKFFCSLILDDQSYVYSLYLEDEEDRADLLKEAALDFTKEYLFRLKDAQENGVTLSEKEKKALLDEMADDYEELKTITDDDGVTETVLSESKFYAYYYGLTKDQFIEFFSNWQIVQNFNQMREDSYEITEEEQRIAYNAFIDYLYTHNVTVISLSTADMSESEIKTMKNFANELAEAITAGDDMATLVQRWCDDEELKEVDGVVKLTPYSEELFPELYKWVSKSKPGDIGVVESKDVIYVVRCDSIIDFDDLVNTEEMIQNAKAYYVDKEINELLSSDKYSFVVKQDAYEACDVSELLDRAITYLLYTLQNSTES